MISDKEPQAFAVVPQPKMELFGYALEDAKVGQLIRVRFDRAEFAEPAGIVERAAATAHRERLNALPPFTNEQIAQARKDVNADGMVLAGIGLERAAIAARVASDDAKRVAAVAKPGRVQKAVAEAHAEVVARRKPDPTKQPRKRHSLGRKK